MDILKTNDFYSEDFSAHFLKQKIVAIVTEYTIFKLDLAIDKVIFRCLQGIYTFEILFQTIEEELKLRPKELRNFLLESVITYYSIQNQTENKFLYPICEFETIDNLLDWHTEWNTLSEEEKVKYLEKL